ncbi:NAD(P)-binding protein [Fimicolochytrium jonesii]|uniref:NAD(P)-binding protein n=1 Tax=Fimicolochytrium jonesii TaxID=1396493 RepID=UPI0022FF2DA6|nr:NAD(P)-binding protein [Fimicolochytrium jonesii]KAI8818034.1 NAD(P)-binding protein [Fimicolochytrium jonesii]
MTNLLAKTVLSLEVGELNLITLACLAGTLLLGRLLFSFLHLLYTITLRPRADLSKYGAKKGAWAVVTGASDGIGKEFAVQLAKAGFNLVILARTESKLETVKKTVVEKYAVECKVVPFDFAKATEKEYEGLSGTLAPLDVGVLVNNVAVNHEFPTPFALESESLLASIVEVDVAAQVRLTRMLLPHLTSRSQTNRKNGGLILNVGSVAGLIPSPYLATYSGAKAFLRTWSRALAVECRQHNVHVEHIKTYFVSTAMSKIRKASLLAPTPATYVHSVLSGAGNSADSASYPPHAILTWALENLVPESIAIEKSGDMHLGLRKRALRKKEREAKAL